MTERQARDEGAKQTQLIMNAVKKLRAVKGWSAEQLAEQMTKAGVPWNAHVVVNLEHGRRKSLRVHELLALLLVLDVEQPLTVMVPGGEHEGFPVVPRLAARPEVVRAWLRGEGKPLPRTTGGQAPDMTLETAARIFEQQGQPDLAASMRRLAELLSTPGGWR